MKTLGDITKKIRSKNAGPFTLTIDIFCFDKEGYQKIIEILTLKKISNLLDIGILSLIRNYC